MHFRFLGSAVGVVELHIAEAAVPFLVNVNERLMSLFVASDQHPLPDVELAIFKLLQLFYQKWLLDVLLNYFVCVFSLVAQLELLMVDAEELDAVPQQRNACPSGASYWFHNPQISIRLETLVPCLAFQKHTVVTPQHRQYLRIDVCGFEVNRIILGTRIVLVFDDALPILIACSQQRAQY